MFRRLLAFAIFASAVVAQSNAQAQTALDVNLYEHFLKVPATKKMEIPYLIGGRDDYRTLVQQTLLAHPGTVATLKDHGQLFVLGHAEDTSPCLIIVAPNAQTEIFGKKQNYEMHRDLLFRKRAFKVREPHVDFDRDGSEWYYFLPGDPYKGLKWSTALVKKDSQTFVKVQVDQTLGKYTYATRAWQEATLIPLTLCQLSEHTSCKISPPRGLTAQTMQVQTCSPNRL